MTAPLLYFLTPESGTWPTYALKPDGSIPARRGPVEGPGGVVGALATPCAGCLHLEYLPERQRWVQVRKATEGVSGLWIGVDPEAEIVPDALARDVIRPGHAVELGDGHLWEIPVARLAFGGSGLPRRRVLNDDGTRTWEVEEQYQALSGFAERVYALRRGQPSIVSDADVDTFCGAALSVNYRIHTDEAVALGLLTDDGIRKIMDALLDYPTMMQILEAQKKSTSTPGS